MTAIRALSLPAFVVATLGLTASSAFAAVIDFTSGAHSGANGRDTYQTTVDGVVVTLTAQPSPAADLVHSSSGIGIDYNDLNGGSAARQIEGAEVLTVSFDQAVTVDELYITNLYDWGALQIEVGTYTIDGETAEFTADSSSGRLTVGVDAAPTTSISFRATGSWASWIDNGFSLGGISFTSAAGVASVPELDPNAAGSALAMLIGGMLLLNARRQRAA